MPNLAVFQCNNNEFIKKTPGFRKIMIAKIPTLAYINDKPVDDDERRIAEAFIKGSYEAERAERRIIK
jgi:dynein assembly factor 1